MRLDFGGISQNSSSVYVTATEVGEAVDSRLE
jgi:hypothetical protein